MKLLWAITGSGTFLRETFNVMVGIRRRFKVKITTILSRAGVEVAKMYGVFDRLCEVSPGSRYEEIFIDEYSASGYPIAGRLALRRYGVLVLAPTTSNTIAKIVRGIADTMVTTAFSQAIKSGVDVIVLPSDYGIECETTLPCMVHYDVCRGCSTCKPLEQCPYGAIYRIEGGTVTIDLMKCRGCEKCVKLCPYNAIECWRRVTVKPSPVDIENLERLRKFKGVYIVNSPKALEVKVLELLGVKR